MIPSLLVYAVLNDTNNIKFTRINDNSPTCINDTKFEDINDIKPTGINDTKFEDTNYTKFEDTNFTKFEDTNTKFEGIVQTLRALDLQANTSPSL